MKIAKHQKKKPQKMPLDFILLASVALLFGLGLVTLYSGSYSYAEDARKDGFHFISRQLGFGVGGALVFCLAIFFNLERLRHKTIVTLALLVTLALNIIPALWGREINGARRWFPGPFSFQPSELAKIVLPFYLAHMLDRKQERLDNFTGAVLPLLIVSALFTCVILFQNSFAIAAFLALNAWLVLLMAGVKKRHLISVFIFAIIIAAAMVVMRPHRIARFYYYLHPDEGSLTGNYQVQQSIDAVASGGFWGKGLGQGDMSDVLEVQSDFIFSAFAEELGFLGILLFVCLFALFTVQGYIVAYRADAVFRRLLAFSYVTILTLQTFINLAVIIRVVPTTGIPLPFFSAGGSSLISSLAICGMIVNVSRFSNVPLELRYSMQR
ncbi:MAG: FtsW/RodA/SpoVE family cell cycle protein [Treponema sp.]|jgi:cell division protein FtsW|nr:FtsW/RodA/SpoVE family cell cycle protein [Treponema sp.]